MQEQKEDISFFETSKKKKANIDISSKLDYTLFKKIGKTVLILYGIYFAVNSYNNYSEFRKLEEVKEIKQEAILKETQRNELSAKIKSITANDFENYILYLKTNQNIYDEKVNLITQSLVEAEKSWKSSTNNNPKQVRDLEYIKNLKKIHFEYKQTFIDGIEDHISVYNDINKYNKKEFNIYNAEYLLKYYYIYQSNSMLINDKLEEVLNDNLYTTYPGNKKYNSDNNIYKTYELLDEKNKSFFKDTNTNKTTSVKP